MPSTAINPELDGLLSSLAVELQAPAHKSAVRRIKRAFVFDVLGEPSARWVLDANGLRASANEPAEIDLRVRAEAGVLHRWLLGQLDVSAALVQGELQIDGAPSALDRLAAIFTPPLTGPAHAVRKS